MTAIAPKKRTDGPPAARPVWDRPTRLFHWLLVALIAFSWWSGENKQLDWHIWSGLAVLTLLIFRFLWGLFGSSTARFAGFVRGPRGVVAYLRDQRSWQAPGHSPLGALSVVALLLVIALQVGLGLFATDEDGFNAGPLATLVSGDTSDAAAALHKTLFNVLLGLIGLHLAAIAYYRLFRGKKLIGPMITGRSETVGDAMRPGKWWSALICAAVALAITRWIIAGAPPFGP